MIYLCDTNIISEGMKRIPDLRVKQWLSDQQTVCLSVITVEEIYNGLAYKSAQKQLEWFEKFLRFRAEVLPITFAIAIEHKKGSLNCKRIFPPHPHLHLFNN